MTETLLILSHVVHWVLTLVLTFAVFALYRYHGQLLVTSRKGRSEQGPAVDLTAVRVETRDIQGAPLLIPTAGRASLVVFASTACGPCARSIEAVAMFAAERADDLDVVYVCKGDSVDDVIRFTAPLPASVRRVRDTGWRVGSRFRVTTTPFAFVADREGVVRAKGRPASLKGYQQLAEHLNSSGATTVAASPSLDVPELVRT